MKKFILRTVIINDGDHKFVLNFWVEDLEKEYNRLKVLNIGAMTEIEKDE